jgi:DMSO/TMAO reductase YedYZ molybdopterin-dependent catalytic subunit
LIERNAWPEHWETTVEALGRSFLTANDAFFVRSHLPVPDLDTSEHRLEIKGLVARPLMLTLADLKAMPKTALTCVLECAGNGRGLMKLANTSGTQWGLGAVGNAAFYGVRLADLLERAGVASEAKHVWFDAADRGVLPGVPPFVRSIPIEVATGDVLVAYAMNGDPLPRLHGGPLRAVVPGWFGMASTKWLTGIRVMPKPSDNHFMTRGYRYAPPPPGADPASMPAVETLRVKSLITKPLDGSNMPRGMLRVDGFAWAGPSGVAKVEVSVDDGQTWRSAELERSAHPYAWRAWHAQLHARARTGATLAILACATDGAGAMQPRVAETNPAGYGNNAMHRVVVKTNA